MQRNGGKGENRSRAQLEAGIDYWKEDDAAGIRLVRIGEQFPGLPKSCVIVSNFGASAIT